jgi:hypothetical protein
MPPLKLSTPRSFTDFIGTIENIPKNKNNHFWYRGCGESSYTLEPRLYRHRTEKRIEELVKLEYQLMTRFRQRSIPFHNRSLSDDWDTLFFMQHYEIPTRLLDWTENPFIAFYFAVMSAKYNFDGKKFIFDKPAAVWVLNPIEWNRYALRHESFDQGILTTADEQLKGYKPSAKFTSMNEYPVALYGSHNSPRIVAQRGVFTIFGQNMSPMEKLYQTDNFPSGCLTKIQLNTNVLPRMRYAILNYGITESVVFPDLEGLAKEIRRTFEFKD